MWRESITASLVRLTLLDVISRVVVASAALRYSEGDKQHQRKRHDGT
jgi:hypothetical protein